MPLQGVVDGIDGVSLTDARAERTYNLNGQRSTSQHGVLVKKTRSLFANNLSKGESEPGE